jgi:hypothetical protein
VVRLTAEGCRVGRGEHRAQGVGPHRHVVVIDAVPPVTVAGLPLGLVPSWNCTLPAAGWTTTELRRVPDLKILKFSHLTYFAAVIKINAVTARDADEVEPTGCRTYPYLVVTR